MLILGVHIESAIKIKSESFFKDSTITFLIVCVKDPTKLHNICFFSNVLSIFLESRISHLSSYIKGIGICPEQQPYTTVFIGKSKRHPSSY